MALYSLTFNNITFVLLLQILLILLHGAHTRAMAKLLTAADETSTHVVPRRSPIINVEKDSYGGVRAVAAEVENRGIGGRKAMMFKRILGEAKEEGFNNIINGGQYPNIISTSSAGSAHNSVGNRNLKVVQHRLRSSNIAGPRHAKKVKIRAGFIPFNADYHVPKPHPPKNN